MAKIVINYTAARREANEASVRFVRQVLNEIRFNARLRLFSGPYTTGRLARSIHFEGPFVQLGRVRAEVGSDLSYARVVEEGAQPHVIRPFRAKALHFYWRRVGNWVFFDAVNHPGSAPKRYLREAARIVARRHNMIVVFYEV